MCPTHSGLLKCIHFGGHHTNCQRVTVSADLSRFIKRLCSWPASGSIRGPACCPGRWCDGVLTGCCGGGFFWRLRRILAIALLVWGLLLLVGRFFGVPSPSVLLHFGTSYWNTSPLANQNRSVSATTAVSWSCILWGVPFVCGSSADCLLFHFCAPIISSFEAIICPHPLSCPRPSASCTGR